MRRNRRIIGALAAMLLSLALAFPASAAISSYKLERDDLVRRVWDAAVTNQIAYTTYYNIGEVACADMQEAAVTIEGTGGKVLINFDTLIDDKVTARIIVNPILVKTGEGSFNFIVDTTAETNAAAKEKFETMLNRPVAVMTCGQSGDFGMTVVLIGKLDLTGINKEKLIAYAYDPEQKTYSLIQNAQCMADEQGFTYLQTRQAGTIIITSAD